MRLLAAFLTALVPSAAAWTPLGGPVLPQVTPSLVVTQAGTRLASWDSPTTGTILVSRNGAAPATVVTGDPSAGQTQLLQQPGGAIQLYFPNAKGVARMTSVDDGATWSAPVQTQSHTVGGVEAAALLPDGTPLFAQSGTGFVNVFRGLSGETSKNVYTRCCGYHVSLAVDSTGLAQTAFYSNADTDGASAYEPLGADLTPASTTALKPVAEHEAPLVADREGNTFLAWAPGYPTATSISVVPFRNGFPAGDGVGFRGPFPGGDPHLALAVDRQDRVWTVWSDGLALHAARSRSHGMHFGAVVTAPLPSNVHALTAAALDGNPGTVDVIVNTGSGLVEQQLQPGLAVRVFKKTKPVKKKKVVTWYAQVLDDTVGVAGATLSAHGRSVRTDGAGTAPLAKLRKGSAKAAAPGYAGASFHVP